MTTLITRAQLLRRTVTLQIDGHEVTVPEGTTILDAACLLYTSDAADERSSVDLGGRRIINKKNSDPAVAELCLTNRYKEHK